MSGIEARVLADPRRAVNLDGLVNDLTNLWHHGFNSAYIYARLLPTSIAWRLQHSQTHGTDLNARLEITSMFCRVGDRLTKGDSYRRA